MDVSFSGQPRYWPTIWQTDFNLPRCTVHTVSAELLPDRSGSTSGVSVQMGSYQSAICEWWEQQTITNTVNTSLVTKFKGRLQSWQWWRRCTKLAVNHIVATMTLTKWMKGKFWLHKWSEVDFALQWNTVDIHVPGLTWPAAVVGTLSASFSTLYAGDTSALFNSSSSSSSTGRFITLLSTSVVTADSAELVTLANNRLVVSAANVLLHVTGLSSNSRGLQNDTAAAPTVDAVKEKIYWQGNEV